MKTKTKYLNFKLYVLAIGLTFFSCNVEEASDVSENTISETTSEAAEIANKAAPSDEAIAIRFAPIFYQDVDTTDGACRNQSKSGSADWITAVNYDGDWNTKNNWENMVSARNSGKLIPYVYYYVTYTKTHFFILYSVYHPRDWTDIPFLCSIDTHENDMEAVLVTAERKPNGGFGSVINAQTIFHTQVLDYTKSELKLVNNTRTRVFIEAKGHGMRAYRGSSDQDKTHIVYKHTSKKAVSPNRDARKLPQTVGYNLLALEKTIWRQRNNRQTVSGTSFVGDNGDGNNRASVPWGWEGGQLCKNPAQYLKSKYNWSNFSTNYISDRPIR